MPSNGLSDEKESMQRSSLGAHFLSRVFSRLEGEEKTAGRKRFSQSVLTAVFKRVRHSDPKQENTKR